MKKIFLFLLVSVFSGALLTASSQNIGIGTPNPLNKLHVAGGFRLDTLANGIDSGVLRHDRNGVVYSLKFTGNAAHVLRGDGIFGPGGSGSGAAWLLSGNSGIDSASQFLGTTDARPLLFRVNNQLAGLIHPTHGNTAFGLKALSSNTPVFIDNGIHGTRWEGVNNTANGYYALSSNTTGYGNTANGYRALFSNTTGYDNTANGNIALYSNTTGQGNTATGIVALYYNTTGSVNTALGFGALYNNTTGGGNTGIGPNALAGNITGFDNVAMGSNALVANGNGFYNTAVGNAVLERTRDAQYNTAMGFGAGYDFNNGWNNTFIGAEADVNGPGYFNCIALGNVTTCTAPNQMRVGNTSTSSIGGQVGWTTLSDERMKTNVQENVKGLDFIKMLRPVTYNLDANKLSGWLKEDRHGNEKNKTPNAAADDLMRKSRNEKSKMVFSGFLAQDVEMAARKLGYNFSGVDAPKNENDLYGLRYSDFVVPLVKAVQEQQQQIEELKNEINELKKLILAK
jgi:hypothetical protein